MLKHHLVWYVNTSLIDWNRINIYTFKIIIHFTHGSIYDVGDFNQHV